MNKICLINGSTKNEASYNYLLNLKKYLKGDINFINSYKFTEEDINIIGEANTIIFSFPLYVDALPSHFLNFISNLEGFIQNKNIYCICNCGFYEGIHAKVALKVIENFCLKSSNKYLGGLGIGGGPIGYKKYPIINLSIKKSIKKLALKINEINTYNNKFTNSKIPRFLYLLLGNHSWNKQIKNKN